MMNRPLPSVAEVAEFQLIEFLKHQRFFNEVSDATLHHFVEQSRIKTYPKRNILFMQEDEAHHFYFIMHGWVKLFRETLDGNEAVTDILTTGHMFGVTSLFENKIYPYSAEAVESVKLVQLPISSLEEMIKSDKKLALNMLSAISRRSREQGHEIEHLSMQTAAQRLGCFLLRLCPMDSTGEVILRLPYDKTLLASRLGMKPETFSRSLKKLGEQVDLSVDGATVRIHDIEQMSHYACNACSQTFPCEAHD